MSDRDIKSPLDKSQAGAQVLARLIEQGDPEPRITFTLDVDDQASEIMDQLRSQIEAGIGLPAALAAGPVERPERDRKVQIEFVQSGERFDGRMRPDGSVWIAWGLARAYGVKVGQRVKIGDEELLLDRVHVPRKQALSYLYAPVQWWFKPVPPEPEIRSLAQLAVQLDGTVRKAEYSEGGGQAGIQNNRGAASASEGS